LGVSENICPDKRSWQNNYLFAEVSEGTGDS